VQELFIAAVYFLYLALGLVAPFVFGLGYVWVDIFTPQAVAANVFGAFPVAMVMGIACFGGYIIADRRHRPKIGLSIVLLLVFAAWMTLTCTWAVVPNAVDKWDWAFKACVFAAFMPFIFRSRIQIEAVLLTIIFAISGNVLAVAAKTLITGGGYGARMTLVEGNSGLAEGSTISMLSVAIIPLILFIGRHSVIFPRRWYTVVAFGGLVACCLITAVGLFTRTGLVALGVFVVLAWMQSRYKIVLGAAFAAVICVLLPFAGASWLDRMSTIENPTSESSAAARIGVWKWTLDYVSEHPLGGGFDVFKISSFSLTLADGSIVNKQGVAFHSIYFEILGEMGIVGFGIWGLLILTFFLGMIRLRRKTRITEGVEWLGGLATALTTSVIIYLVGGAFIGIGFQPTLYFLIAVSIAAREYWRRISSVGQSQARQWGPRGLIDATPAPELGR
jgi:putative inorganic carbon (hco3(-)) transporter